MAVSFEKRQRERVRQERQAERDARRKARRESKPEKRVLGPGGEDPDIAGIIPGPQPKPEEDV
jgi:hypothetical protein